MSGDLKKLGARWIKYFFLMILFISITLFQVWNFSLLMQIAIFLSFMSPPKKEEKEPEM